MDHNVVFKTYYPHVLTQEVLHFEYCSKQCDFLVMRPLENIRLCSCLYLVHKSQNYKNNTYEVLPRQRRCLAAETVRMEMTWLITLCKHLFLIIIIISACFVLVNICICFWTLNLQFKLPHEILCQFKRQISAYWWQLSDGHRILRPQNLVIYL